MKYKRYQAIVQLIFTLLLLFTTVWVLMDMRNRNLAISYAVGILVWNINNMWIKRCPHCKKLGLRPNPFKADAGICKYCNELVEYE